MFNARLCDLCVTVRRNLALRHLASFVLGAALGSGYVCTYSPAALADVRAFTLNGRTRHINVNMGFMHDAADSGDVSLSLDPNPWLLALH